MWSRSVWASHNYPHWLRLRRLEPKIVCNVKEKYWCKTKIYQIGKSASVAKPVALRVGVDLMFRIVDKFNSVAGIEKKRYQFENRSLENILYFIFYSLSLSFYLLSCSLLEEVWIEPEIRKHTCFGND